MILLVYRYDDGKEEEDIKFSSKDIIAFIIAFYKTFLPIILAFTLMMLLIFYLLMYVWS